MATTYVSAGTYIQEKDDSLYTPAAAPTIVGLVGTATKGPLNTATLVTNEGQLIDTFGRPRTKDRAMQAAIEILKDCRTLYFVRIAGAAGASGLVTIQDTGSGPTAASIGPSANGETFDLTPNDFIRLEIDGVLQPDLVFDATAAARESQNTEATPFNFNAINAGGAVTLTVKIDGGATQTITMDSTMFINYAACTAEEVALAIAGQIVGAQASATTGGTKVTITSDVKGLDSKVQVTGGTANDATNGLNFVTTVASGTSTAGIGNIDAVTGSEIEAFIETTFAGVLLVDVGTGGEITIKTVATGSTHSLEISSASTAVGAAPLINLTPLDSAVPGTDTAAAADTVRFNAASYGTWSEDLEVIVSASSVLSGCVKVVIRYRDIVVETFDKLYKSPTPVTGGYALVDTINNGSSDGAYSASEYVVATGLNVGSAENPAAGTYALSAGNNGDNWTQSTVIGTVSGTTRTGLQCFANPETIDVAILATPGISYAAVIAAGLDICENRGDCLFVADCPYGLSPQEVTDWHNGVHGSAVVVDQESRTEISSTLYNSSYGAVYYPFVEQFDKYNDQNVWLPPSGVVIRSMVYTDESADPWWAPAGPNRSQTVAVLDLEYSATLGERDIMMSPGNSVNPLANLSGIGVTIMGQKTLQRAPTALDRVNVRRLLLYLEKQIARSTKLLMFEQNDEIMWRRFINLVTPMLEDVKSRRGLYDYRVVADSSTTTPFQIDNNTFIGKIFLKPTKTAEILIIGFNLVPTGANFEEFVQS